MKKLYAMLLMMGLATQVAAFTPESGFYSEAAAPGTGFTVEVQDNFVFVAGYFYSPQGAPTWFTTQGVLTKTATGTFTLTASMDTFINGQCIGANCPYRAPNAGANAGSMNLTFLSNGSIAVSYGSAGNQRSATLTRFNYATGASVIEQFLGEWDVLVDRGGTSGQQQYFYVAEKLLFNDKFSISGRGTVITGCVPTIEGATTCSSFIASGVGSSGANGSQDITISVGASASAIDRIYTFNVAPGRALNQYTGKSFHCTVGQTETQCLTNSSRPAVAYRSASATYARNGNGPD